MNAPAGITARARLRAATADIHQALHDAAPFAAIANGSVTLEGYGRTLAFLHRYHGCMMPYCVRGALALGLPGLAAAQAARLQALERDLAHLGVVPAVTMAEQPGDDGLCAGVLYTVMGSMLGGKVIFRQLDALLPDDEGRSFFRGGPDDSRNWQVLVAALDGFTGDQALLEAGAMHAFVQFEAMVPATGLEPVTP